MNSHTYGEWKPWFAWYPVRLLSMEWKWLCMVVYRKPGMGGQWSYRGVDYSWYRRV
jgi:hypothetical protein